MRRTWSEHLVGTPGRGTSYQHESSGSGGGSSRLPTPQTGNMITHTNSHYTHTHTPKDIIRTQKIYLLGKKSTTKNCVPAYPLSSFENRHFHQHHPHAKSCAPLEDLLHVINSIQQILGRLAPRILGFADKKCCIVIWSMSTLVLRFPWEAVQKMVPCKHIFHLRKWPIFSLGDAFA